jgi:hypothetical protein
VVVVEVRPGAAHLEEGSAMTAWEMMSTAAVVAAGHADEATGLEAAYDLGGLDRSVPGVRGRTGNGVLIGRPATSCSAWR